MAFTLKRAALLGLLLPTSLAAAALPTADQATLADGTRVQLGFDDDSNEILLRTHKPAGESHLRRYRLGGEVLENVCLSLQESGINLYAVSDRGYLAQWQLLGDNFIPVRTLPGVVEGKDCHVDDASQTLYVLEEGLGIWRYGAAAGDSYDRSLIARFAPAGRLDPEVEEFSVSAGSLMVGAQAVASLSSPAPASDIRAVLATAETAAVAMHGDSADDAAIWRHPAEAADSLILGTDKRYGLRVYDLQGRELRSIPVGRINNVDLRPLPKHPRFEALAAASNRSRQTISLFGISAGGEVEWLQDAEVATGLDDPYGLCMYSSDDQPHVFINDKDGRLQLWRLEAKRGSFAASRLWEIQLEDQPEGCVADDQQQRLFFGIEDKGLYALDISPDKPGKAQMLAGVEASELHADVEGMDLYLRDDGGYLVVSSQGNNSFAVYDRLPPHAYRGSFRVAQNSAQRIDGVSDTDGLSVHSGALGKTYPRGLLVVQDGYNVLPRENQNFKLIDWRDIEEALGLGQ